MFPSAKLHHQETPEQDHKNDNKRLKKIHHYRNDQQALLTNI